MNLMNDLKELRSNWKGYNMLEKLLVGGGFLFMAFFVLVIALELLVWS